MRNKVITILFFLLLVLGPGLHFITPDKYYSESEKRTLTKFPSVTFKSIFSGEFGDEIESYLADQFPYRDTWVAVKTVAERLSGKKESGGVYFSDDGYLIEKHTVFDTEQTALNVSALKELQDRLSEVNAEFSVLLIPDAGEILSEKLPEFSANADRKAVIEYTKEQGVNVIDVTGTLEEHKDEYIYYKTDHHWTSLGAYYAYASWKAAKGEQAEPLSAWEKEVLSDNFRGTTYSKVNYPFAPFDTIEAYYKTGMHTVNYNEGNYITDSIYERSYLEGSDQYAVFLNSNQSTTEVSGNGDKKLLIIKDSYANCFAQFCIDEYEETHLIDLRFYRKSVIKYIEENGIDEVLVLYNIPNFTVDTAISRCAK